MTHDLVESPWGPITVVCTGDGLREVCFREPTKEDGAAAELPAGIQLREYLSGVRRTFELELDPEGTEWQKRVWSELAKIPYGQTTTYGEIARTLGRPTASRAVGAANGSNPIAIVVPCHRVVGANGSLTGYAGGLERKRGLLALERGGELFG